MKINNNHSQIARSLMCIKQSSISWLVTLALFASCSQSESGSNQSQQTSSEYSSELPNIVYILVDDLGYGDINLGIESIEEFNNPNIQTPNLAKLARESKVFRHHYAASPVCSPSRAGLLTGRTPTRHNINWWIMDKKDNDKILLPGSEITIPEILKEKDYQTSVFGKWHLNGADWEVKENWTGWTGSFPNQQGFDAGMVTKEDPHFTRMLNVNTQKHPGDYFDLDGTPKGPMKGYTSDIISQNALKWIKNLPDKSKPFFTYLAYDAVHIRIMAGDKFTNMYDTGDPRRDEYYANISHLDAAIGDLLEGLEELGLKENTIIYFSSDNGPDVLRAWDATYFCYGTSYPLYGQKYQLYQGGIRVPAMVRWPGKITPEVSDEPNSTLDVLPTLCELLEIDLPADRAIDGESILDHLLDNKSIEREKPMYWQFEIPREYEVIVGEGYYNHMFDGSKISDAMQNYFQAVGAGENPGDKSLQIKYGVEIMAPHAAIREGDYMLYGYHTDPFALPVKYEMYNLVEDPKEKNELSEVEPELFSTLKSKLAEIYQEVNAERVKTEAAIKAKDCR